MKINKIDFILIITSLSCFFLYFYKKSPSYIRNQSLVIKDVPQVTKTNDILKLKTIIPRNLINNNMTTASCTLFLTSTAEISLMEFANEFIDHKFDQSLNTCIGTFSDALKNKILDAQTLCSHDQREKISRQCFKKIINLKSEAVVSIIKEEAPIDMLPPSVLVHFLNLNMNNGQYVENPKRGIELLNAILKDEPNYISGYKTKLLLISLLEKEDRKKFDSNFNQTLQAAKKIAPNDHELTELELAFISGLLKKSITPKDYSHFLSYLREEIKNDNKDWAIEYYKAWATWNHGTGDFNQVLKMLEKALLRDPKNKKILSTIDNLKNGDDEIKLHPFIPPFSFDLDDL